MRIVVLCLVLSAVAFGQTFSAGLKAGVPATDAFATASAFPTFYSSTTKRYTIGPTVEVGLPLNFAVELDVLYKHLNYNSVVRGTDTLTQNGTSGNSWEIPLLAKYRFAKGPLRPFVDGGVSARHAGGETQTTNTVFPSSVFRSSGSPAELRNAWTAGVTFGGGVDVGIKRLHIAPELRYTRWGTENFKTAVTGLLHTNLNQVDFLLGITF